MNEKKKLLFIIGVLLLLISILAGMLIFLFAGKSGERSDDTWSAAQLRKGLETKVEYNQKYNAYISSADEARAAIKEYGVIQREKYKNPSVTEIELAMEREFDLCAVNLGEMDAETAKDVQRAFAYMYETYPQLRGTLTNFTVGNFYEQRASYTALTQNEVFIVNESDAKFPYVVKWEIVLSAAKFFDREKLLKECKTQTEDGYWPENTDISSVVVHEIGHQLLNVAAMREYGLEDPYYITEKNADAYSLFVTDSLASNQTVAKRIEDRAYSIWKETYGNSGSKEEFRKSISLYACGLQPDGGISYGEAFAEAVADLYLNGEKAADASKAMLQSFEEFFRGLS